MDRNLSRKLERLWQAGFASGSQDKAALRARNEWRRLVCAFLHGLSP